MLKRTIVETREASAQQERLITSLQQQNEREGEADELQSQEHSTLKERQSVLDAELPRLQNEIQNLREDLRQQKENIVKLQADVYSSEVTREAVASRTTVWQERRTSLETGMETLLSFTASLSKEITDSEKRLEHEKSTIEALNAEKDRYQMTVNLHQVNKPGKKATLRGTIVGESRATDESET